MRIFPLQRHDIDSVKYDNLLKTIFMEAMPTLLKALHCAPVLELLSVEFPERAKMVADIVARLADGKILHLEFQLTNDPRMHWRCYHYFGAIQEQWEDSEVIQVVVYLGNGEMTMKPIINKPSCKYHYQLVDIREIPPGFFLNSPEDSERVLALLCNSADPRDTIRRVLGSWRHLTDKRLLENIERLRTLSQLRKTEIIAIEEIDQMPFELDITESVTYKMGEARGGANSLTLILEALFGPLPASAHDRIAQASKDEIAQWLLRAVRANSLTDVFVSPS